MKPKQSQISKCIWCRSEKKAETELCPKCYRFNSSQYDKYLLSLS